MDAAANQAVASVVAVFPLVTTSGKMRHRTLYNTVRYYTAPGSQQNSIQSIVSFPNPEPVFTRAFAFVIIESSDSHFHVIRRILFLPVNQPCSSYSPVGALALCASL